MKATCVVCNQIKTVCCDDGNDGTTSENPMCQDCCPSRNRRVIWDGMGAGGGVYERG